MRLFVAIRPPAAALDHLRTALLDVRAGAGRILHWSDPEQWHLTLAFHPDVPEGALEDVVAASAAVATRHEPFSAQLAGAGQFSRRTLWIGTGTGSPQVEELLAEDWWGEGAPDPAGRDEPAGSHRRAHLTVARVSARSPELRRSRRRRGPERGPDPAALLLGDAVRALAVYRGPTWTVEEIEVVASALGEGRGGGPRHEVLAAVALGA